MYALIMPLCNLSKKYEGKIPVEFQYQDNGYMNCINSLLTINLDNASNIYFSIYYEHENKFDISSQIRTQLNRAGIKAMLNFYIITHKTSCQAETILETILFHSIKGPIFIKDGDNCCVYTEEIPPCNSVMVYELEDCPIVDPQHKSYVTVDDNMYVTNIIEKRVVSNLFNCGGYSFLNAEDFVNTYNILKRTLKEGEHICISHIIYYLILFKKQVFKPIMAKAYNDFDLNI